jgi:hypothetical protein
MEIFKQQSISKNSPAAANICFKKVGLSHFAGGESQIGGSVPGKKFSAKTPHLLKAKRRYASA